MLVNSVGPHLTTIPPPPHFGMFATSLRKKEYRVIFYGKMYAASLSRRSDKHLQVMPNNLATNQMEAAEWPEKQSQAKFYSNQFVI